jgi:hypothetical protein
LLYCVSLRGSTALRTHSRPFHTRRRLWRSKWNARRADHVAGTRIGQFIRPGCNAWSRGSARDQDGRIRWWAGDWPSRHRIEAPLGHVARAGQVAGRLAARVRRKPTSSTRGPATGGKEQDCGPKYESFETGHRGEPRRAASATPAGDLNEFCAVVYFLQRKAVNKRDPPVNSGGSLWRIWCNWIVVFNPLISLLPPLRPDPPWALERTSESSPNAAHVRPGAPKIERRTGSDKSRQFPCACNSPLG